MSNVVNSCIYILAMFLTLSAFEVDSGSKVYLLAINICIIILFSLSLASFNEKKMQLNI